MRETPYGSAHFISSFLIFNSCLSELLLRPVPPARSYVGIMMEYQHTPSNLPLKPHGVVTAKTYTLESISTGINILKFNFKYLNYVDVMSGVTVAAERNTYLLSHTTHYNVENAALQFFIQKCDSRIG